MISRLTTARVFAFVGVALVMAACATLAENKLPQAKRDALRIDAVELNFAPNATIIWEDVLLEFNRSGQPDTPQARIAFVESKASAKIRSAVEAEVRPVFRGSNPAKLRIVIRQIEVPSALRRALIGGSNSILADISLVDARTGEVLLNSDFRANAAGASGIGIVIDPFIDEPVIRVGRNFGRALAQWLKTGQAFVGG